jgi:hypothetical protein
MNESTNWPEGGFQELQDVTARQNHTPKLEEKPRKLKTPSFGEAGDIRQHIAFLAWLMLNNPKLYLEFERIADATWQANPGRELSPTFIWTTLRHHSRAATEGDQFAVNNNGLPLVSRMYALARPDRKIAMRDCWLDHLNDDELALLPPFKAYRFGL